MNKYIFVLIVCAVVFLICFLIDTLFKVIFRNPNSKKQAGRPPAEEKRGGRCDPDLRGRRCADQKSGWNAGYAVSHRQHCGDHLRRDFAVYLFSVVIYFDDEGFLYKAWGHGKKSSATARSEASGACSRAAA